MSVSRHDEFDHFLDTNNPRIVLGNLDWAPSDVLYAMDETAYYYGKLEFEDMMETFGKVDVKNA